MTNELKPRRMGVTRAMKGLPSVPKQELQLVDNECFPVFTWAEFGQAIPSFIEGDVVVAVNAKVFGSAKYPFETVALSDDIPKAKTGPKPTLDKCKPETWRAIAWIAAHKGYPSAVEFAATEGIKTDRHAIYYRLNRQTKDEIKRTLGKDPAAIDEGKE